MPLQLIYQLSMIQLLLDYCAYCFGPHQVKCTFQRSKSSVKNMPTAKTITHSLSACVTCYQFIALFIPSDFLYSAKVRGHRYRVASDWVTNA